MLAVVTLATGVSQSFGRFTYGLLLTDVRTDLTISNTVAGTLGSANLAAYLAGSLIVSLVVGRLGLRTVSRTGIVVVTAGLIVLASGASPLLVALGLVMTGLGAAGVWVTAPGLAIAELGPERRATAIGVVTAGVGLGMVSASYLDAVMDWRGVYRVEAAVAVVVAVLVSTILRRPVPALGRRVGGLTAIRQVPGWRPLLWSYGVYATALAIVATFMVALLEEDAGYAPTEAAVAFSLLGVGTVAGGPLFGPIADRFGRSIALGGALGTMMVAATVIASGHRPGAALAAFGFGTAFTGVPVSVGARIGDFVEGDRFGAAYGVATLAFGAGLTVGPQLGGALSDLTGSFRPAFAVATGCVLLAVALVPAATRAPAGRGGPPVGNLRSS